MIQVGLVDLAQKTGLEPKVIRRILRKAGFRAPYGWDDTNPAYQQALEACKEAGQPKSKSEKPKRDHKHTPVVWDSRGICEVEGSLWAIVFVPTIADPSVQREESIWLGKKADVLPILSGESEVPADWSHLQRLALTKIREVK